MQEQPDQQNKCMLVKLQGESEEQCLMRQQGLQANAMRQSGGQGGMGDAMSMAKMGKQAYDLYNAGSTSGGAGGGAAGGAGTGGGAAASAASYAAPVAAMAGFMKMAKDEGLIDKNNEVMEDSWDTMKDGLKGLYGDSDKIEKPLQKLLKPWEWF